MTYQQAVTYLLEQLPMFQRVGAAAYRADLGNITALCHILGNPQSDLKCIHIAGTNGKGSVTHLIASILQEQGYKVGVFVSPHYKDYRERIKINGKYIGKRFVTKFVDENRERFKDVNASFFEITTAMAFAYFKKKKVDYAVIETGMGGRLDSTNIITPLLSVITNIGYDHQQFLGDTLEKIAGEKAGIIKQNVPVVTGTTQVETEKVFRKKAEDCNAKIVFADSRKYRKNWRSALTARYQKQNVQTAAVAAEVLRKQGVELKEKAIRKGLLNVVQNTRFFGRWMVMKKQPTVIFDSAHNADGLAALRSELKHRSYRQLHFVYGTVGDKDISANLSLLPKNATYYFCKANLPRAMDAAQLQEKAKGYGLKGEVYASVKQAYKAAKKAAGKKDMVLVAGSVFVVAEVL